MKPKLSPRQERILRYITDFVELHGYSPTIRTMQRELKISSTSVVAYNLQILADKGILQRDKGVSRSVRLVAPEAMAAPRPQLSVPLLGVITAGAPLPDPEDTSQAPVEYIPLPALLPWGVTRPDGIFALRVRGTSMIDALIADGDVVFLRRQETAENGQMVAVQLVQENAVTLKRLYREGDRVRLQPANVTMEPIYTTADNIRIQGRVVGVTRAL